MGITSLKLENPLAVLPPLAEAVLDMDADGVEINTSCPNEGSDKLLCHNIVAMQRVIAAVRQRIGAEPYVTVKTSSLGETHIRRLKQRLDVDGVCTMNGRRRRSPVDPQTGRPVIEVNNGYAGQSGPVINAPARRNLRSWLRPPTGPADFPIKNSQFDVWSVGGVEGGYEAYDRVENIGAFAVGCAQLFYRSADPAETAKRLAQEYEAAQAAAGR